MKTQNVVSTNRMIEEINGVDAHELYINMDINKRKEVNVMNIIKDLATSFKSLRDIILPNLKTSVLNQVNALKWVNKVIIPCNVGISIEIPLRVVYERTIMKDMTKLSKREIMVSDIRFFEK